MATELQQTLNESEETVSVSRTAIQSLLARAQEANTLIEECVARGVSDERITIAFGGVTKTVTKLLLHCPRDEVDREQLKEVLEQFESILESCETAEDLAQLATPLTESYLQLLEF
ncbi:hypothetical protein F441_20215 [Phytophthora nicotianae CJ01A1]|nr:hypothetical protein F444_20343 [Phytophthora nicotianae P1976]ETP02758.1 hypothetical protein F441_20215 [Phytophthora nicotianae CJ01A1]ETP30899.1 hypothetical protein F442_20155 [Phytophthora nicotianae P10297]